LQWIGTCGRRTNTSVRAEVQTGQGLALICTLRR
jgi:hypothetical protein